VRTNPLTKPPNRIQFQYFLQRSIARARRSGKSLYLFYVDLDHFKEVNDTFVHLAGDTTLEPTAERMLAALRKSQLLDASLARNLR
jgi:diguanylate cyclase (GGDEF)-like protein|tara:strand:+ start:222 stop:479 length:258 start_codon:yes stop_codon:yes gene_type:complete